MQPAPNPFEQLVRKFLPQARLLRHWPLTGGVSATITALEVQHPDSRLQKCVVRQHGPVDRQHNPQIAADEFRLLEVLQAARVAAPRPYYLDATGELLSTPCVVIEFVEGETDFAPANLTDYVQQMAAQLARIHQVTAPPHDLAFLPTQAAAYAAKLSQRPAPLDESLSEGQIRSVLEGGWPPANPATLLHGDFWPGNLLWHSGQLRAVIDWEDALVGDPLADLGNARLELLWAFGPEAMQAFTRHYLDLMPLNPTSLPYYDLYAALRPASKLGTWGLPPATEADYRAKHRAFVAEALHALGTG